MADIDRDLPDYVPLYPDETEETVLERMLIWANEDLEPDDPRYRDTREGSHLRTCLVPGARELARFYDLAGTEAVSAAFPIRAWADYLDDHAELQNIDRKAAAFATGGVLLAGEIGAVVPAGTTVGVPPADVDAEAPAFETTAARTIPAALSPPTGLSGTPSASGGVLTTATYRYVVTALDDGGETLKSAEASAAVTGPTGKVTLSWTALAGARAYMVYRGTAPGGPYAALALVTAAAYVDDGSATPGAAPPSSNTTGGKVSAPVRAVEAGTESNVAAGAITEVLTPDTADSVTNPLATGGGTDEEDDEALRDRLLDAYAGKGAGNKLDYRRWALAYPGVGRATVIPLWNGPNTVRVVVTDEDGNPVSSEVVDGLQAVLDPTPGLGEGDAPIGAEVTVSTAARLGIIVAATIEFEPGYSLDDDNPQREAIEAAVSSYIESVEPGGEVVRQHVIGRIVSVTGVHDTGSVTLDGGATNVAVDDDPPQVPYLVTPATLTEGSV